MQLRLRLRLRLLFRMLLIGHPAFLLTVLPRHSEARIQRGTKLSKQLAVKISRIGELFFFWRNHLRILAPGSFSEPIYSEGSENSG